MKNPLLDLYSDYLISSFALITATGLSHLLDNAYSHDQITRFLSGAEHTSRDLWALVKPTVRSVESDDGVLIFDDTIQEKPHSDENEVIAWHFDHCANRTVKGVNILNCLYRADEASLPVAFEIVHKDLQYCEVATRKLKRHSSVTKNERLRRMLRVCEQNQLRYRYVLTDNWFSSKENMAFIKIELGKEFVMALKSNRTVALSLEDKRQGPFRPRECAPARGEHRSAGLHQRASLPGGVGQASLYEQRRKHRCPLSGVKRPPARLRSHHGNLPKKVERRGLSQIGQI